MPSRKAIHVNPIRNFDPPYTNTSITDLPLALSRWRTITAYLRPDLFSKPHQTSSSPEESTRINDHALAFSNAFMPFASPQLTDDKNKHLAEVLRTALQTALWLLSQPASFRFDWTPIDVRDRGARGVVVVVPGLLKTHDENGGKLENGMIAMACVTKKA